MDLDALGPAHHRRWRGECSNQSSAPALAAWALLQARVVPSLFAYLRPGCCSIAVASMNSCSGPFSLHIFPLFIRSFDLRRCAFPVISTSCFARLALPCLVLLARQGRCFVPAIASSFILSLSSSRHCSFFQIAFIFPRGVCFLALISRGRTNGGWWRDRTQEKSLAGRRGRSFGELGAKKVRNPWVNRQAKQRRHCRRLQLCLRDPGAHINRFSGLALRQRIRLTRALV